MKIIQKQFLYKCNTLLETSYKVPPLTSQAQQKRILINIPVNTCWETEMTQVLLGVVFQCWTWNPELLPSHRAQQDLPCHLSEEGTVHKRHSKYRDPLLFSGALALNLQSRTLLPGDLDHLAGPMSLWFGIKQAEQSSGLKSPAIKSFVHYFNQTQGCTQFSC